MFVQLRSTSQFGQVHWPVVLTVGSADLIIQPNQPTNFIGTGVFVVGVRKINSIKYMYPQTDVPALDPLHWGYDFLV